MDKFLITTSTYKCLLVLSISVTCCLSLEEASPEVFLEPRNFNPHPYEVAQRRGGMNGPVVFPANPEDNFVDNRNNIIALVKAPRRLKNRHPVDNHPYTKVARKHRYKVTGRFGDQDNEQVSNRDYKALAKHATKVLSYPPEELRKSYSPSDEKRQGKDYAFSYKVLDHLTGDDFSHSQTRNSKATNGEYRVKLPDGRVQIVSYTADKNGYKADVKYTENEGDAAQDGTLLSHHDHNPQIQRVPVKEFYSVIDAKPVEYDADVQQNHGVLVLQAVVPKQIPALFNGNADVVASPSPAYLNVVENKDLQGHLQPRVQIYTTNARDYTIGSYVPATLSPYTSNHIINSGRSTISPQITNDGDHGLYAPSTSSSFVVTDQHGQVIDNIKLVSTTASPLFVENYVTRTTPTPFILSNPNHRNRGSTVAHIF